MSQQGNDEMRGLPSDNIWAGRQNELIECPNCGKKMGMRHSAKAYEGNSVNKCWACDFMWSHEDDEVLWEGGGV